MRRRGAEHGRPVEGALELALRELEAFVVGARGCFAHIHARTGRISLVIQRVAEWSESRLHRTAKPVQMQVRGARRGGNAPARAPWGVGAKPAKPAVDAVRAAIVMERSIAASDRKCDDAERRSARAQSGRHVDRSRCDLGGHSPRILDEIFVHTEMSRLMSAEFRN